MQLPSLHRTVALCRGLTELTANPGAGPLPLCRADTGLRDEKRLPSLEGSRRTRERSAALDSRRGSVASGGSLWPNDVYGKTGFACLHDGVCAAAPLAARGLAIPHSDESVCPLQQSPVGVLVG